MGAPPARPTCTDNKGQHFPAHHTSSCGKPEESSTQAPNIGEGFERPWTRIGSTHVKVEEYSDKSESTKGKIESPSTKPESSDVDIEDPPALQLKVLDKKTDESIIDKLDCASPSSGLYSSVQSSSQAVQLVPLAKRDLVTDYTLRNAQPAKDNLVELGAEILAPVVSKA